MELLVGLRPWQLSVPPERLVPVERAAVTPPTETPAVRGMFRA